MATTFLKVKNRAVSTLASEISDADLSLDVKAGEGVKFPNAFPFHITIQDEILVCTNRVTDTLTVTRAAQGTDASKHAKSAVVSLNITAQNISDLNTAVNTLEGYCPSAAVLKTLFDAGTVLYATADNTPLAKTRAQLIALLSGQAGGAFSLNAQELTNAKLNALVLKGVFTADGVVTLPAFKLGGSIDADGKDIINVDELKSKTTDFLLIAGEHDDGTGLSIVTKRTAANAGIGIIIRSFNAVDAQTTRLSLTSGVAEAVMACTNLNWTGLKLGNAFILNGQAFDAGSGYAQVDTTGVVALNLAKSIQLTEMSAPGAGAANTARMYAHLVDGGKTELCVIFQSGAVQVLATEP